MILVNKKMALIWKYKKFCFHPPHISKHRAEIFLMMILCMILVLQHVLHKIVVASLGAEMNR
jgi:hypothetical protein